MSRWTGEQEYLLRLLLPTNSFDEIAEEFHRRASKALSGFVDEKSADAIRRKCERDELNQDATVDPFQTRWRQIEEIGEIHRLEHEINSVGLVGKENITRKILCLSDIHFPFAREELLQQAMAEHSDADVIVLNGDIVDGYIFSTFPKTRSVPATHEYMQAFNLVKVASEMFPHVVLVSGNHDARVAKAMARANFNDDMTQILRPDLIARLAQGEELDQFGELIAKHNFKNVIYQHPETWWVQIGMTIFVHPSGFQGGPGGTTHKLDKIFSERFGTTAYDSIVCGHTHKISKLVYNNRLLIEQGSLSCRQDYEHKENLKFTHAMNGYCVVYQDKDGNTDFNLSGPIYLGSSLPPKKKVL